tara:strand:- start:232 stop:336 length:105 start_codon:yes stop_codon:yes gene_type:complete
MEKGSKIFNTSKYPYPNNKNVGVPNNNRPIPKID